ncbi:hypothetical protein [Marinobacter sp.]|jgi:hypothetical protein|uniref:hypothetical protein n=1 Tax=Marinobacter sp. TaxID=50741 RepID=UPI000C49896F|nr:hypothetical protein [Marinobacter sp.]MBE95588.1 hypothetical protein [Marinobacter sp.]|tara:strand:+ start:10 stop:387 length:378 start_codon:yes stop_codon:yes gene_type:complete
MTITKSQIFFLLLSLIMVISAPALAVSEMADVQVDASMMDCGSMIADATGTNGSAYDDVASCFTGSDMACPTANGLNSCGVSIGLFPTGLSGLIDAGSQPLFSALEGSYQAPYLAFITPPPENRS